MHIKVLLIVSVLSGTWAICPSPEDAAPCTCDEATLKFDCSERTSEGPEEWDIKAYFDRIATLVPKNVIFDDILITATNLVTIPAGAIETVKFNKINIEFNYQLEYIHPDAFGETAYVTTYLSIISNIKLANAGEGHTEHDLFDVISKFTSATDILIFHNIITSVPDEGFGPLPNLRRFRLCPLNLDRLGSRTFSGLSNLESANLNTCNISLTKIADDAFEGLAPNAEILMEHNPFTRLPEVPFKTLLDNGKVAIGGVDCFFACRNILLDCDEESAWLCQDVENYEPRVKGFFCKGELENIWDYCAGQTNNTSVNRNF